MKLFEIIRPLFIDTNFLAVTESFGESIGIGISIERNKFDEIYR